MSNRATIITKSKVNWSGILFGDNWKANIKANVVTFEGPIFNNTIVRDVENEKVYQTLNFLSGDMPCKEHCLYKPLFCIFEEFNDYTETRQESLLKQMKSLGYI